MGSCKGLDKVTPANDTNGVFTTQYRKFLWDWANAQMEAYEDGSSMGWFFWNFKTEVAPQWNYILGLTEGWIPKQSERTRGCTREVIDSYAGR